MSFSVVGYVNQNRLNENKIILRGFFGKCHSFPSNWKDIEQTTWISKECIKQCYANKNTNALGKQSNLFIDPRRTRNALFYSRVRPFFRIIFIIGNLSEWYYVIYLRMSDFFYDFIRVLVRVNFKNRKCPKVRLPQSWNSFVCRHCFDRQSIMKYSTRSFAETTPTSRSDSSKTNSRLNLSCAKYSKMLCSVWAVLHECIASGVVTSVRCCSRTSLRVRSRLATASSASVARVKKVMSDRE